MDERTFDRLLSGIGFPPALRTDGLLVTFEDGHLTRLSWDPPDGVELRITGARKAELIWHRGSGGTPDYERYEADGYERFDAWSDNEGVRPMAWDAWLRKAVLVVVDVGCFLCRTPLASRRGIAFSADGTACLCRSCWRRVTWTPPLPRQHAFGAHRCDLCETDLPDSDELYEGKRRLCPACVDAMTVPRWWWPW